MFIVSDVPSNRQPDSDTPNPLTRGTGPSAPDKFDPANPKDLAMLRRMIDRHPRYKGITPEMREEVMQAVIGSLRSAMEPKDVAALAKTFVQMDRMNQADEHLALKLANEQSIANTPRQVIHWTDPPRPPLP